jgi:serine phosphatase RsbU (regulator of sigma subunit)
VSKLNEKVSIIFIIGKLACLAFAFYAFTSNAQDPIELFEGKQISYSLNKYLQVLPDINGTYTIQQVTTSDYSIFFKKDSTLNPKANYHWIRFTIANKNNLQIDWHLKITPKQYNEIYVLNKNDLELFAKNGEYVRNSESIFPENPNVIPIKLPANTDVTYYIRMNTVLKKEFRPNISIELVSAAKEMNFYMRSWIILAVLVGVLSSLGFYIIFQFILFRDKSFLYFFLAFFSMALYFITFERVGYAITGSDHITRFTGNYIALMCTFFYIGFSRYFLDPDKRFPIWHKILKWLQISYIIPLTLIVLINLGFFWNFTPVVHLIHIIAFIFLLSFAIIAFKKRQSLAGYYLWANTIFFFFLCLFVYYVIKKPSENTLTNYLLASSLKIGSFGQVLLFTLALSNRFSQLSRNVVEKQLENELLEKAQIMKIQNITYNANIELEKKVKERIAEISSQKEELQSQAENISTAYKKITQQKKMIEQAHTQITDSLFYASLIQGAVLPSTKVMTQCFTDSFAIYWPRDIVSGDFYWVTKIDDVVLFAVADCTGHGVPGGFMSMLGISQLNEIIKRERIIQPEMVLSILRENLITALQQDTFDNEVRDGMDIGLCAISKDIQSPESDDFTMVFAGIQIPCYISKAKNENIDIATNAELIRSTDETLLYMMKPNKIPINMGISPDSFHLKKIHLNKGDMVYLATDGITDLIGGEYQKKFSKKRLQDILVNIHQFNSEEQKNIIENSINEWINSPDPITGSPNDQIDDICILGIRI